MIRANVRTGEIMKGDRPLVVSLPLRIVHSLNWWNKGKTLQARNWKATCAYEERESFAGHIREAKKKTDLKPPFTITIIRGFMSPNRKYDRDNYIGGCKHIRDGITDGLGYKNDDHPDLEWNYEQKKTSINADDSVLLGVEIIIEEAK